MKRLIHSVALTFGCLPSLVPLIAADGPANDLLARWETASERMVAPSAEVLSRRYGATHSAHELEVAAALLGEVSADRLAAQFEWTSAATETEDLRLTGRPRDGLARLFYASVAVVLDQATHLPASLRFSDRDGKPRTQTIVAAGPLRAARHQPALLPVPDDAAEVRLAANVQQANEKAAVVAGPKAEALLERWEQATRELRTADLRFTRYVYDAILEVESRGQGRFYFEAPSRGLYELRPAAAAADSPSQRRNAAGEPYRVVAEGSLTCVWNGTHLVHVDEQQKTFERTPIPENLHSDIRPVGSFDMVWAGMAGPQRALPGVVDAHTNDFISRFDWSVLKHDERQVLLQGRPIEQHDRFHLSELLVILDPLSFLTTATRMKNADGTRETVHVFHYDRVNRALDAPGGRWEPDLTGYREISPPPPAPPAVVIDD